MIDTALREARDEGNSVSVVAADIAYGVAASLSFPARLAPSVVDNELGGIVFFWKGASREIQLEIDADSSHFVRIKGARGEVVFSQEGLGPIPIYEINAALTEWSVEQHLRFRSTLTTVA